MILTQNKTSGKQVFYKYIVNHTITNSHKQRDVQKQIFSFSIMVCNTSMLLILLILLYTSMSL